MNIKEVAKLARVSTATVSNTINGKGKVGEKTRKRIMQLIRRHGYQVSGAARELKTKETKTIGLFSHIISGHYYQALIDGIKSVTEKHGYDLIVTNNYNSRNPEILPRLLLEKRVDGGIIFLKNISDRNIEEMSRLDIPLVVLDREVYRKNMCSVLIENRLGIAEAVKFLKSGNIGSCGYLTCPEEQYDTAERLIAFEKEVSGNKIKFRKEWLFSGECTEEGGYSAAEAVCRLKDRPEAIICYNDLMAICLIQGLRDKGIRVPDDMSIIGFDDITISRYISPKLTTVKSPIFNIGRLAADTVFRGIAGENIEGVTKLPSNLIVRESTRPMN